MRSPEQALEKTLLLVMANKQDVKGCMTAGEISQGLAYVPRPEASACAHLSAGNWRLTSHISAD